VAGDDAATASATAADDADMSRLSSFPRFAISWWFSVKDDESMWFMALGVVVVFL
jgi:hypothetical protein